MSRIATSVVSASGGGKSAGCSTRTKANGVSDNRHPGFGLGDDVLHDRRQALRAREHLELAVRAGPAPHDLVHVGGLRPRAELVDYTVDKVEQRDERPPSRHFAPLAEVDELAVETEARRAPLVLVDQR